MIVILLAGFVVLLTASHLAGIAAAAMRCRPARGQLIAPANAPAVSIVVPVCGLENYLEQTLRTAFRLDYPNYELLFCVARADDPAVPLVRRLIAEHSAIPAQLLIGDERISGNPKLNNVFKGWRAARHAWIAMPDSNVLIPRDYLQRLFASWDASTGLVCSPPIGARPDGFWAALECAFLNSYQARWQYLADTLGFGFAQGKTMFWRRAVLEQAGGIRMLGRDAAEDAASTKIVRAAGLRVRLVDPPVRQPLGRRRARDVWKRQTRWARLRRASFPLYFLPEILTSALWPFALTALLALQVGFSPLLAVLALAVLWYGAELLLILRADWPLSRATLPCLILRDLMLPILWIDALGGRNFEWRGTQMDAVEGARAS
jgi:ceramide glucosyltransferase